ncbi:MAG TPA: serine/threonine-protein kinase, partial [Pseudomonadota bacterium]|nr:serine/threonine-protein kinase [Pseudomonadota bacterium]
MAEIYLAAPEGSESRHRLAIKVIHQQNADDPDFVRMLVDEARLAVQLKHPNIVTTYDLGLANDQYYIVMELVEGADLFRLQQRAADQRLSFPIPLAAYIAREVARGLDYAHRLRDSDGHPLQVVHRDISPQNVLLSYEGAVKITDFGIAKAARRAAQTQAGIIKGKYYYMSPEQASGQFIDGRTDIFAAGILLYEMLIGEMLYYDDNVDRLLQVVRKADIPPVSQRRPDTPPALERVLMKALCKSPSDRYQTAAEYSQALDNYLRRYAPRLGAADVGAFLEKLIGEKVRRRTLNESTAAMAVSADALNQPPLASAVSAGGDATIGLSSAQIQELGISDENSLIFQSKGLAALLQGGSNSSAGGRRTPSSLTAAARGSETGRGPTGKPDEPGKGPGGERKGEPKGERKGEPKGERKGEPAGAPAGAGAGGDASGDADDDDGLIKTTRLSVDSAKLASRRSSSGTMEVVVPSLRSGGSSASSSSPEEPSGEVPAEGPESLSGARRSGPRPVRSLVSKPSEVFRAIEPEVEEELLAGAAELTRETYALTAPRRLLSSGPRHEPLAAQLASAEVT